MSAAILRLVGVSQQYGAGELAVSALSGIDLEVMPGELVAVMGASGSGKSTLLSIAGGLQTADPTAAGRPDAPHCNRMTPNTSRRAHRMHSARMPRRP